ncbi:MAG: M48 family metalloprotease [Candidatus Wallbacteria bacterium]|nr:M48 family metalloprotease [Candidatus Wallbacteria bacterium]
MNRRLVIAMVVVLPAWLVIELAFWPRVAGGADMLARLGLGTFTRATAYAQAHYRWFGAAVATQLVLCLALATEPVSRALELLLASGGPVRGAAWISMVCLAGSHGLGLAFGFVSGHLLDLQYGLTQQSTWAWLKEQLLARGLSAGFTAAAVAAAIWTAQSFGRRWWLASSVLTGAAVVGVMMLQPVAIDPLFDHYAPLAGRPGSEHFLALAQRAGFDPARLSVAEVSHRTTKGNAFVNGLGPTERIALWDTFLEASRADEAELVLAHELGHWLAGHVRIGTALALVAILAVPMLGSFVFPCPGPRDVPALLLALLLVRLSSLPVENAVSRAIEAQADWLSLRLTGKPDAFIRAEEQLARQNLSEPAPTAAAVWFFYTHPPAADRIAMAERYARSRPR